jgi:uncharacterized protein YkwD
MKRITAVLLVFLLLFTLTTPAGAASQFADVSPDAWYAVAVTFVVNEGIMHGTGDSTFSPNGMMSRAMVATILHRLAGEPAVVFEPVFADVPAGRWYSSAVIWASSNQIVHGVGSGRFAPHDNVTREQLATLLFRFAVFSDMDTDVPRSHNLLPFDDRMQISSWAVAPLLWATYHGLITGTSDTTLTPAGTANRAQCAVILYRFLQLGNTSPQPDPEPPVEEPRPPVPDPPIAIPPNATAEEWRMFEQVNEIRAAHNSPPIQWCNCLADVARAHSFDMWLRDFHGHANPDGIGPGGRIRNAGIDFIVASENIASGFRTPEAANEGFMGSPTHRQTLLAPGWTHIGIGHWDGGSGIFDGIHWTQKFIHQPDHRCAP